MPERIGVLRVPVNLGDTGKIQKIDKKTELCGRSPAKFRSEFSSQVYDRMAELLIATSHRPAATVAEQSLEQSRTAAGIAARITAGRLAALRLAARSRLAAGGCFAAHWLATGWLAAHRLAAHRLAAATEQAAGISRGSHHGKHRENQADSHNSRELHVTFS